MRKPVVSLALLAVAAGFAGCASMGEYREGGAPNGGVTGVTVKRAAVQSPDSLDFGADVQTVEAYDLDAATAGTSHFVGADTERDQEIDAIIDTISDEAKQPLAGPSRPAAKPATQSAPSARPPAVPPLPKAGASAHTASGVTANTARVKAPVLPPLPASVTSSAATEEELAMAARQDRLFPKPLWRRVLAQQTPNDAPTAPRGF